MRVDPLFWHNRRVFMTGHTGFKGSWLSLWLQEMGASLTGYALNPDGPLSLFEEAAVGERMESRIADVLDLSRLTEAMAVARPEILIHLAAQPLVRRSYREPVETYATNVMGTVHVLEAARSSASLRAIVCVTSDKCYENREWDWGYRESDPVGGHDPYSSSKGCAELVACAYRSSYFDPAGRIGLATARAGNVIGGGDWAADRIVPDALAAFASGETLKLRNPNAIRPWQHVLEPLSGYLVLAQALFGDDGDYSGAWNFGPSEDDARTVEEIVELVARCWNDDARWERVPGAHPHEAGCLKLDTSKARMRLGWRPKWSVAETARRIAAWHKAWMACGDARALSVAEISEYTREH